MVDAFTLQPRTQEHASLYTGYDLMEIALICLDPQKATPEHGCLGLLSAILVKKCSSAELKRLLVEEFGIILTEEIDEGVEQMCNLSEGVYQRGVAEGEARGKAEGRAEGRAEGKAEGRAEALGALMRSLSCSLEAAMDMLGIPSSERQHYERLVAELA